MTLISQPIPSSSPVPSFALQACKGCGCRNVGQSRTQICLDSPGSIGDAGLRHRSCQIGCPCSSGSHKEPHINTITDFPDGGTSELKSNNLGLAALHSLIVALPVVGPKYASTFPLRAGKLAKDSTPRM